MEDVGWRPRKLDSKCYLVCGLWWLFGCLKVAKWFLLGKFWNKLESVIQVSGCAQYHCHHVSVYKYAKDTQTFRAVCAEFSKSWGSWGSLDSSARSWGSIMASVFSLSLSKVRYTICNVTASLM